MPASGHGTWGWHRLTPAWADRLVADAGVAPGDLVLDVGAGTGALTAPLVAAGARVIAVELHPGRAAALRRRFAGDDVVVVHADAADLRLPRRPFRVVANPPFARTTAILGRLLAPGIPPGAGRRGGAAGRGPALGRGPGARGRALVPDLRRRPRPPDPPGRVRPAAEGGLHGPAGGAQPAASPALTAAPSSQQASRSSRDGGPTSDSGACAARHRSPVTILSMPASAPAVSSLPWTHTP